MSSPHKRRAKPGWVERVARWQPWYILSRSTGSTARAVFVVVGGFLAIAILGFGALITRAPILFPSLGPTAFLVFSAPSVPTSSPRNVIFSHSLGLLCGLAALLLTGLWTAGPGVPGEISVARVLAPGIAMALTGGVMLLLDCVHPPGISTALIVALGLMDDSSQKATLLGAAILLCLLAWVINRLAGVYYPLWRCKSVVHRDGIATRALMMEEGPKEPAQEDVIAKLARDLVTGQRVHGAARR